MWRYILIALLSSATTANDAVLRVATTSSTENSGLMEYLIPDFQSHCSCVVRMLVSGSGQALALARRGDVDALLTHAPAAEKKFMHEGFGSRRVSVMVNDFILLAPTESNAIPHTHFADNDSLMQWMQNFANQAANKSQTPPLKFISRGDGSGTHQKEQSLWQIADITPQPSGGWYVQSGSGMGQTLLIADQLRAYTLSDRGTYLAFQEKIDLQIIGSGAPALRNPYSAIMVNPKKHPHVQHKLAAQFLSWLISPPTQQKIQNFRFHNQILFHPAVKVSNSGK